MDYDLWPSQPVWTEAAFLPINGMASWRRNSVWMRSSWVFSSSCSSRLGILPGGGWEERQERKLASQFNKCLSIWTSKDFKSAFKICCYCDLSEWVSFVNNWTALYNINMKLLLYFLKLCLVKKHKPVLWTEWRSQTLCTPPTPSVLWSCEAPQLSWLSQRWISPFLSHLVSPCHQLNTVHIQARYLDLGVKTRN